MKRHRFPEAIHEPPPFFGVVHESTFKFEAKLPLGMLTIVAPLR